MLTGFSGKASLNETAYRRTDTARQHAAGRFSMRAYNEPMDMEALRRAYRFAQRTALYASLYAGIPEPKTLEDWGRLPYTTKADLEASPIPERIRSDVCPIRTLAASSGTSGKPPLITPRSRVDGFEYRASAHDFKHGLASSLRFTHREDNFLRSHGSMQTAVAIDPRHLSLSARLIAARGIDAVYVHSFLAQRLAEELVRCGHAEAIRLIELMGEISSSQLLQELASMLPNARIYAELGASEIDGSPFAVSCMSAQEGEFREIYHHKDGYYLELIDPGNAEVLKPQEGAEGELVVTTLSESVSPLVRYRLGDIVRIEKAPCAHGRWSFSVRGRAVLDFVKIPGGMLRADECMRALSAILNGRMPEFQMRWVRSAALPYGVLCIEGLSADTDKHAYARTMEQELRIGPDVTYADAVLKGFCGPLQIKELENTAGKHTRLAVE